MKQAGMEMLGATQGVEGPPCSTPGLLVASLPRRLPFCTLLLLGKLGGQHQKREKGYHRRKEKPKTK